MENKDKNIDEMLEKFAEYLADGNALEKLKKQIEEYIKENVTEKPYITKIVSSTIIWVAKAVVVKAGSKSKEKLLETLKKEYFADTRLGKLLVYILGKWWNVINNEREKVREKLKQLEVVLSGKESIDKYGQEIAYVAKMMSSIEEVKSQLNKGFQEIILKLSKNDQKLPIIDWYARFNPYDGIGRYLITTKLVGREDIIAKFESFLAAEQPVMIIGGAAGIGKTRLSIEMCRLADIEGWDAYYLKNTYSQITWTANKIRNKILLIVDYAVSNPNIDNLLNSIYEIRSSIKIVLIEREYFVEQLTRKVSALMSDSSLKKILAFERPMMITPLPTNKEKNLFENYSTLSYPDELRKLTLGNPLLTIIAAEELNNSNQEIDLSKMSKNELLMRRIQYLDKYREQLGEDHFQNMCKIIIIAVFARGLIKNDYEVWLPKIAPNLGLPKDILSITTLIKQARLVTMGNDPFYGQEYSDIDLIIQPDMVASALLAREFSRDGLFKGQIDIFVKAIADYRPKELALSLMMAIDDIGEDSFLAEGKATLINIIINKRRDENKFDYLLALVYVVGAGVKLPEIKPVLLASYINDWLSENQTSSWEIWCLCALTVDLFEPAIMFPMLNKIASHPNFFGKDAANVILRLIYTGKIPFQLVEVITEKAYLNNPEVLHTKALAAMVLIDKYSSIEDLELLISNEESAQVIFNICLLGNMIYEHNRPEIGNRIAGLINRINAKFNYPGFIILKAMNIAASIGKKNSDRRVLAALNKLISITKESKDYINEGMVGAATVNAIIKINDSRKLIELIDYVRDLYGTSSDIMHPMILADALSNVYSKLCKSHGKDADVYLDELFKHYEDHKEENVQCALAGALFASLGATNSLEIARERYAKLKVIIGEKNPNTHIYPRNINSPSPKKEMLIIWLKAQFIAVTIGIYDSLEEIIDLLKTYHAFPIQKSFGTIHPYWFVLKIFIEDKGSPLEKDRKYIYIKKLLNEMENNVDKWFNHYDRANTLKDNQEYLAAFAELEIACSITSGIPEQNKLSALELMYFVAIKAFGAETAKIKCEKWEEKIGVKSGLVVLDNDFPIDLIQ